MPVDAGNIPIRGDWKDYYLALGYSRLQLSPRSAAADWQDLIMPGGVGVVNTGSGAHAFNAATSTGVTQLSSGAAAGTSLLSPSPSAGPAVGVSNIRTKKWFLAVRYAITVAPDANTRIWLGMYSTTTNDIAGFGMLGPTSTTIYRIGKVSSAYALTGSASTVVVGTGFVSAYVFNDTTNFYGSVNDEPEITPFASSSLTSEAGWWRFITAPAGGVQADILQIDAVCFIGER